MKNFTKKSWKSILISLILGFLYASTATATATTPDLSGISDKLTGQIKSLSGLLVTISYIAGIGFFLVGLIQLKAHKDSPTQVPLSKGVVYLGVGAGLLFLPTVIASAGRTIFGFADGANYAKTSAGTANVLGSSAAGFES